MILLFQKKRNIFLKLVPLIFSFIVWGCTEEDQSHDSSINKGNVRKRDVYPTQEGWNSKIFISNAGKRRAVVNYGHMVNYGQQKIYYFDEGVSVDFYDIDGNHTSHLISETGEFHEITEDVIGKGNVIVESDSGITLYTEVLKWDNRLGKIISDTTVMVTTLEGDTLYGVGFESEPDLSRRVVRKPWGVSEKKIYIEELEKSFSRKSTADTIAVSDSIKEGENIQ